MAHADHLDLYQLTSLVPHWDAGLGEAPVSMSFFSRRMPRDLQKNTVRGFLLWAGLRRCLEWLRDARLSEETLRRLEDHPLMGPALRQRPALRSALADWRFRGRVCSAPEGTVLWAGQAVDAQGQRLDFDGVRPSAQLPYLLVDTDLLSAKIIETPLLSIINHMTMVASKAARVVLAAGDRSVLEFGQRRTHPEAAVDAAWAAWTAGCVGTSNVAAHRLHGMPVLGTMDHFAVQAWEQPDRPQHETERAFFEAFHRVWPEQSVLLVDTYDSFGEQTGIRSAVAAAGSALRGIRLDSQITPENIRRARALLDELGAPDAQIVVSGGMDEYAIAELGDAPVDAFGIGERIVTSPDAPVGVGAVGKLCLIQGRPTMKKSRGSGKATLPGRVQVFRDGWTDRVVPWGEQAPGTAMLEPVWEEDRILDLPSKEEARAHAREQIAQLPLEQRAERPREIEVSPALEQIIAGLCS